MRTLNTTEHQKVHGGLSGGAIVLIGAASGAVTGAAIHACGSRTRVTPLQGNDSMDAISWGLGAIIDVSAGALGCCCWSGGLALVGSTLGLISAGIMDSQGALDDW